MGSSSSKPAKNDAMHLCKERVKCINQVIESRNALSAAHLSYIQSLESIGTALRQFAEANISIESSISLSEVDKSPPYSSCGSPSSSRFIEHISSASGSGSPSSPRMQNMNYMRAAGASVLTITIDSLATSFVDDVALTTPYRDIASWDYFDPTSAVTNLQWLNGQPCKRIIRSGKPQEAEVIPLSEEEVMVSCKEKQSVQNNVPLEGFSENFKSVNLTHEVDDDRSLNSGSPSVKGSIETIIRIASSEISGSGKENRKVHREIFAEREDASEFITHRAKCFLSSMRDIEHRFLRAAEAGNEISRMLETNKLRLHNDFENRGISSSSQLASVLNRVCCKGLPFLKHGGSLQNMTKVITWNHSVSSLSSPSRIPLTSAAKDDEDNNTASDFTEELCMISGSHSSTLDRLYAWECKLCHEIKYNEDIRKAYDQKCRHLRHQCARDQDAGLIDSTRAIVKDLHSRMGVSIQSVKSISKRIEMLRDSELQPQLVELIRGLIRMWKSMLECHHAQFITISLAYLTKCSTEMSPGEPHRQALVHVRNKLSYFNHSFSNCINAYKLYVEALSSWLQKCILQPQERRKGRRAAVFPPRQALSPPIFVLCNDWLLGLKSLPARELCDSIEDVIAILLHESFEQTVEGELSGKVAGQPECNQGSEAKQEQNCGRHSSLHELKASLTRLFNRLTKFSETSLRVLEDVKQASEIAYIAYASVVIE